MDHPAHAGPRNPPTLFSGKYVIFAHIDADLSMIEITVKARTGVRKQHNTLRASLPLVGNRDLTFI